MIFFCSWPERASLIVDHEDEDKARALATEVAEGEAPSTVRAIGAGLFVAEVFVDEDEDGADLLVVEPLPHVAEALSALELEAETPAPALELVHSVCGAELEEARDDGSIVLHRCRLAPHGAGTMHEATEPDGSIVEWSDDAA